MSESFVGRYHPSQRQFGIQRRQSKMIQQLRKKRGDEGGFTLIELLIVIIILGILAAIVVFAVGNTRKDSVANSCKPDVKSVELSAEAVNTKAGSYPATSDAGNTATNPLVSGQVTPDNG